MGPLKSQNSINITLPAEGTLLNVLVLSSGVFPLHALTFVCRFIVVHLCLIIYDNPLQESLSSTILLQKLHANFHTGLFLLICTQLWHPPCTHFMIPEVLTDDGICRFASDVQLVSCINNSSSSVLEPEH